MLARGVVGSICPEFRPKTGDVVTPEPEEWDQYEERSLAGKTQVVLRTKHATPVAFDSEGVQGLTLT